MSMLLKNKKKLCVGVAKSDAKIGGDKSDTKNGELNHIFKVGI